MSWTKAKPAAEGRGFFHPDQQITDEFKGEFDAVPRPDPTLRNTRIKCTKNDLNYIQSALPSQHVPMENFFEQMAKRQWQGAKPQAGAGGAAPASLSRTGAIGARRDMTGNQIADAARPRLPGGGATDWKLIPELKRVNAYAFRGDRRHPRVVKAADGFHPSSTRTDSAYISVIAYQFSKYMKARFNQTIDTKEIERYIRGQGQTGRVFTEYEVWREILRGEEMHIGRMVADEFMKGFVSTSRDVGTAVGFAQKVAKDGRKDPLCAVYALHVEGGFLLPQNGHQKRLDAHASKSEAEIAYPGSIPWSKVVGFRFLLNTDVGDSRTFQKNSQYVFMRKELRMRDPQGAYQVLLHLAAAFL